jgi:hypothetical protein
VWRFHAFFNSTDPEVLDTVAADQTDREHAIRKPTNTCARFGSEIEVLLEVVASASRGRM